MPGLGSLPPRAARTLGPLGHLGRLDLPLTAGLAVAGVRGAVRARLAPPVNPVRSARLAAALLHWGTTPALGWSTGAARHPDEPAVIDADDDRLPVVTFREAERRTAAVATGLLAAGLGAGTTVGLLGRTSRGYAEAIAALSRAGADVVYLNPGLPAAQLASLAHREHLDAVLCDDDLADRVPDGLARISLGTDRPDGPVAPVPQLAELATGPVRRTHALSRPSRHVILTSGTTGEPRGVARDQAPLDAAVAMLDALPVRPRATHLIAAPLFHAWGWLNHRICAINDATEVLLRRPDGERVLRLAARHRAEVIVVTPVVLHRLVDVPQTVRDELDLTSLRAIAVSGARLPPDLVVAVQAAFGDVLHNLYGSTEAAYATCAGPADLRADPATAGRPLPGVRVEVRDAAGRQCPPGVEGSVWVGSRASFAGYTDGSDRDRSRGLIATGDLGAWDGAGRLRVLGRADDLIISGGENVHPEEVERVLREHPDVAEVAVVGAADPVFGQAVTAYVVRRPAPPANRDARTPSTVTTEDGADPVDQAWVAAFQDWAAARLAPHQRPRSVVLRRDLPHNDAGKLLRRQLRSTVDPQRHRRGRAVGDANGR